MTKRVLCVWLPHWSSQSAGLSQPSLAASIGPAEESLHDPLADRLALKELAGRLGRFSPLVGLEDSDRPESLLLDITGCARLFGGEEALARQVQATLEEQGLCARLAIAQTIGAAWALAHFGECPTPQVQPVQPSGSEAIRKGVRPVRPSHFQPKTNDLRPTPKGSDPFSDSLSLEQALGPLPIESLRLPQDLVGTLRELGIGRIGQLLGLSRKALARFGSHLVLQLARALGEVPEVFLPLSPPPESQASWSFEPPAERQEMVEAALDRLVEEVLGMLGPNQGVRELACRLYREGAPPIEWELGLFEPSVSAGHLGNLLRLRLERVQIEAAQRGLPPGAQAAQRITGIVLQVSQTGPLLARQMLLFEQEEHQEGKRELAGLVDRLSSRLGRRAVLHVRLEPDAQPEFVCRYEPFLASRGRKAAAPITTGARPLRLLSRPAPVTVMSVVPEGPPIRFHWVGGEHRILTSWGPERIETGWWRHGPIQRDYYRVETTAGRRFWLFRRRKDDRWFLHGSFE